MMSLLDFARGPALQVSLGIFTLGVTWRVISLLLMPRLKEKSAPRPGARPAFIAGGREIMRRMWPDQEFARRTLFNLINGYIFHIGLAITVFLAAPHILFFEDLFGLSWPNLPNNVIFAVGVVTLGSLIAALAKRLSNPVQKLISTADDYISWTLTFLPVLTGLMAASHLGARYETLMAIHVLSVAALLVWLPFGKLMHWFLVFVTRGQTGAHLNHRGAQL
jgi:nitrate reductase gamma subunit